MFKILECSFHIDLYVIRNELLRYKKTRVNTRKSVVPNKQENESIKLLLTYVYFAIDQSCK